MEGEEEVVLEVEAETPPARVEDDVMVRAVIVFVLISIPVDSNEFCLPVYASKAISLSNSEAYWNKVENKKLSRANKERKVTVTRRENKLSRRLRTNRGSIN